MTRSPAFLFDFSTTGMFCGLTLGSLKLSEDKKQVFPKLSTRCGLNH